SHVHEPPPPDPLPGPLEQRMVHHAQRDLNGHGGQQAHADDRVRVVEVPHVEAQPDAQAQSHNRRHVARDLHDRVDEDRVARGQRPQQDGAEREDQHKRDRHDDAVGDADGATGGGVGGGGAPATGPAFEEGVGRGEVSRAEGIARGSWRDGLGGAGEEDGGEMVMVRWERVFDG
ncbi:MAG: hypothetical protein Q9187_005027, partial [Circinaria calcarea]